MQFEGQSSDCPLCTTTIVKEVLAKVPACNPGAAQVVFALHPHSPHLVAFSCHCCQCLASRILPLAPLLILGLYKTSTAHIAVSLNSHRTDTQGVGKCTNWCNKNIGGLECPPLFTSMWMVAPYVSPQTFGELSPWILSWTYLCQRDMTHYLWWSINSVMPQS